MGATLWEKATDIYRRTIDAAVEIGRDVLNHLQQLMRGQAPTHDRHEVGGYWQSLIARDNDPKQERDGPER